MNNKNSATYWFNLKNTIDADLEKLMQRGVVNVDNFSNAFQLMSSSMTNKTVFQNPFVKTSAENVFERIYEMLNTYYSKNKNEIKFIPLVLGLVFINRFCSIGLTTYLCNKITRDMSDSSQFEIPILLKEGVAESFSIKNNNISSSLSLDFDLAFIYNTEELHRLMKEAEQHSVSRNYEEAIHIIDQKIKLIVQKYLFHGVIADLVGLLNNKAFYQFQLNKLEDGLKTINAILSCVATSGLFYHTKAEILEKMGNYSEALEAIEKAIQLESTPDKIDFK